MTKAAVGALALLAAVASCSCPCRSVPDDPEVVPYERPHAELQVRESGTVPLEYLAWCSDEDRALGNWQADRGDAEARSAEHEQRAPGHRTTILWRQSPRIRVLPNP